jgi:hypothetical protein
MYENIADTSGSREEPHWMELVVQFFRRLILAVSIFVAAGAA